MKKVVLFFPLLAVLVFLMGCGSENIKIAGEDEAWKVYTYPSNNMFGVEKIVLFEDCAVAVFDVKKCDAGYVPLESVDTDKNSIASVHLDNLSQYKRGESTLEKRNGKYVITARASYDEANKRDNSLPVHAVGLTFEYGNIWCYEDRTYLQYTNTDNSEITEISYQNYYLDSGKWEKIVDESFVEQPAMME